MREPRDHTKYRFNGEVLGKGRLVLALVKQYVLDHADISFEQLRACFPDELQAESPMQFSNEQRVVAKLNQVSDDAKVRYFIGEGEAFPVRDEVVVVSSQWNRFNIAHVLARAKELGFQVEVQP